MRRIIVISESRPNVMEELIEAMAAGGVSIEANSPTVPAHF
jgi:hypothetical protein